MTGVFTRIILAAGWRIAWQGMGAGAEEKQGEQLEGRDNAGEKWPGWRWGRNGRHWGVF